MFVPVQSKRVEPIHLRQVWVQMHWIQASFVAVFWLWAVAPVRIGHIRLVRGLQVCPQLGVAIGLAWFSCWFFGFVAGKAFHWGILV
ncbi:hypothetical protein U1Q18_017333 [Sarracenia purpurea var. burkii]